MSEQLTESQWQQYQKDGYLRLGRLLDDEHLAALQQRIDDIMLGKADVDYDRMLMQLDSSSGDYSDLKSQPGGRGFKGSSLNYRKIQELEYDRRFLSYLQWPIFRDICAREYGPDTPVRCFRAMFMNKPAHKGTKLPWHQDRWRHLDRDPKITIWTALDPATKANGCVEIIPGTHHKLINPDHHSGFLTDEQAAELEDCETEFVELEAGEVVLLHNWLLHRSDVNRTDIPRRGFSVSYMDGRTKNKEGEQPWPIVFGEGALDPDSLETASA